MAVASLETTPISPVVMAGVSVCFLPQTIRVLPMRSGWAVRALMVLLVAVSLPDNTLIKLILPTNGSATVLKT